MMGVKGTDGPVRVLFVNDTARNGGPGRSLYYILKFLDPRLVHRAVVLPRPGAISELLGREGVVDDMMFEPRLVENPVEPWRRPMTRADFTAPLARRGLRLVANGVKATQSVARLARLARAGRYDLLYCNGTTANFLGATLAFLTGVPALWHVRYTSIPGPLQRLHACLAASRHVRRIVCVSRPVAGLFSHVAAKTTVIHNAIDADEYDPRRVSSVLRHELHLRPDAIVFGGHGRILPRKGYIEMLHAARSALGSMTSEERARCHFVIVGDTPEDIRPDHLAECRNLAARLGLGQAHFLGFRLDVRPYVADFDVAVVPSVYPDPLPRAVLESMALGKPVLAFDVGGIGEMVSDGETGTLLAGRPPDVEGMARAFVRYLRDPDLRSAQGSRARERVIAAFGAPVHAERILHEIVRAARRHGGRG